MHKMNKAMLDKLENRLLSAMLGEVELSASVMEIFRRILTDNGRLVEKIKPGDPTEFLTDEDDDEDVIPFPVKS